MKYILIILLVLILWALGQKVQRIERNVERISKNIDLQFLAQQEAEGYSDEAITYLIKQDSLNKLK